MVETKAAISLQKLNWCNDAMCWLTCAIYSKIKGIIYDFELAIFNDLIKNNSITTTCTEPSQNKSSSVPIKFGISKKTNKLEEEFNVSCQK